MKHTNFYQKMLCLVLVMLLAAAALTLTGCSTNAPAPTEAPTETATEAPTEAATEAPATEAETEAPATEAAETEAASDLADLDITELTQLGTGEKVFRFDITDKDGGTSSYAIHTDAETVGEALVENELIEGTESEYGLYVTTVLGQTLDWDADQMYWAFFENGEYAAAGVDTTEIVDGATYAFVATAG